MDAPCAISDRDIYLPPPFLFFSKRASITHLHFHTFVLFFPLNNVTSSDTITRDQCDINYGLRGGSIFGGWGVLVSECPRVSPMKARLLHLHSIVSLFAHWNVYTAEAKAQPAADAASFQPNVVPAHRAHSTPEAAQKPLGQHRHHKSTEEIMKIFDQRPQQETTMRRSRHRFLQGLAPVLLAEWLRVPSKKSKNHHVCSPIGFLSTRYP